MPSRSVFGIGLADHKLTSRPIMVLRDSSFGLPTRQALFIFKILRAEVHVEADMEPCVSIVS